MIVVQIAGRLGKDAESRFTPSGQKVTTLTMATTVRKAGKEETVWWRVTIWGERYDKMVPYFKKGSALIVIGEMSKPDIWTDKEGRPQVSLDMTADIVRFNPFGGSGEKGTQEAGAANQNQTSHTGYGNNAGSNHASQSGHGNNSGDFGGSMQGGSSNYSQSNQSEEPIPF
ncbi:MAG TPA: single-stranded DNA-binding protein [Parachlamydiaceae bacterium]|nr:single-stranded DNA-binding protein [Parachlamydiaceae bacterium]